jgi:WD40 repeat protein
LIAYNYNEKEKGIYSILDFSNLNVGSYQGSQVIGFSFSPDGNYCLIGTFNGDIDKNYNKDLYIYNVADGTVKKILINFCLNENNVIWYSSQDVSQKWIVSAKDDRTSIMWDVNSSKPLGTLPTNIKEAKVNVKKYLYFDNLIVKDNTGYTFKLDTERSADRWWFKDDNTLVGVPFKDTSNMPGSMDLRLLDFEIVEININDKTGKIVFRP